MPRYLSQRERLAALSRAWDDLEALSRGEEVRVTTAALAPGGRAVRRSSDEFEARVSVGAGLAGGRMPARGLGTRPPASRLGGSPRTSATVIHPTIHGLAVPYNAISVLRPAGNLCDRPYRVLFKPGAFREALRSGHASRAAALLNHDRDEVLGRVAYSNLRFKETAAGVEFYLRTTPHPRTQQALRDVKHGYLCGASIHFIDHRCTWHTTPDLEPLMVVERADFDEVSLLSDPAFPGTYLDVIG